MTFPVDPPLGPPSSKQKYPWRAGSGSTSFWFSPWSPLDTPGTLFPYVDIHDLQLTVKDVVSFNDPHTHVLYTQLSHEASTFINNLHYKFNDNVDDAYVWTSHISDTYSTKSGYNWLLTVAADPVSASPTLHSWSWIWKLKLLENISFSFG